MHEGRMRDMIGTVRNEQSNPSEMWRAISDLAAEFKESHALYADFYGQVKSPRDKWLVLYQMSRFRMRGGEKLAPQVMNDPDLRNRALGISLLLPGATPADSPALLSAVRNYLGETDPECRSLLGRVIAGNPNLMQAVGREEIERLVHDPDPIVRQGFMTNIVKGANSDPIVIPLLLDAAAKPDAMTRMAAATGLKSLKAFDGATSIPFAADQDRLIATWINDLGSDDQRVGGAAMYALATLFGTKVKSALQAALSAENLMTRARAGGVLQKSGDSFDPSPLLEVMQNGSEEAQLFACGVLRKAFSQDTNVPIINAGLASPHAAVRQAAVYALEAYEFPSATTALKAALDHTDANVRYRAAIVMGRRKVKDAVRTLEAMAAKEADPQVKKAAEIAAAVAGDKDLAGVLVDRKKFFEEAASLPPRKSPSVAGTPTTIKDGVVQIGTQKQLFVDDLVLENLQDGKRVLHQFKRDSRNPVLEEQFPWELRGVINFCGAVDYDPETRVYTMWYTSNGRLPKLTGTNLPVPEFISRGQLIAYSTDGVQWTRPDIHLTEFNGSKSNNLVGASVNIVRLKNSSDPQRQYASYIYSGKHKALSVSFSPDGIAGWTEFQRVTGGGNDVVTVSRDDLGIGYQAFLKSQTGRWARRSATAHWGEKPDAIGGGSVLITAGFADDRGAADCMALAYPGVNVAHAASFNAQIYGVTPFIYEGIYFGLPQRFIFSGWGPPQEGADGAVDVCLIASRDKRGAGNWTRPGGDGPAYYPPVETGQIHTDERSVQAMHPVLEYGRFGEWDSISNYGCSVLVVDDEIVLYYLGADWGHGHRHQLKTLRAAIGRATMRLDGFVSLRAADHESVISTKPMLFEGTSLMVNADCPTGSLAVELCDADGNPLPGFTKADADKFSGDDLRKVMTWKGKSDLSSLVGRIVKMRFFLKHGDLYAFQAMR